MSTDDDSMILVEDAAVDLAQFEPIIDRGMVVRLAETLEGVHPAAQEIGTRGLRTIAQLALATGVNPLPGGGNGLHAWRDNKGRLAIQFGIGFWRQLASEAGGILWQDRPRPMTQAEREQFGIADGTYAAVARGALKTDAFALRADARQFGDELALRDAVALVAREGIGIAGADEYSKAGRPLQWTALQRAERDLLRQLVSIAKRTRPAASGGHGWHVTDFVREHVELPAGYSMADANADLFGDSDGEAVVIVDFETVEDDGTSAAAAGVEDDAAAAANERTTAGKAAAAGGASKET